MASWKSLFLSDTMLIVVIEPKEPAFLRRLRNEHGGGDSARHERQLPRRKRHQAENDEEDLPAYVDGDSNNTISKAEYDALYTGAGKMQLETDASAESLSQPHAAEMDEAEESGHVVQVKQPEVSIGGGVKRKLAKVITESPDSGDLLLPLNRIASKKRRKKMSQDVKLSFDDT